MINRCDIHVRYAETDMMGVVYHANYLLYLEDARTVFLEEAGVPYIDIEQAGLMCPVYDVQMSYGSPLRYGEAAFVETKIVDVRPTKVTYVQNVYRAGMEPGVDKPCLAARIVACTVERETFKPVVLKRILPDVYARYQEICEPEE